MHWRTYLDGVWGTPPPREIKSTARAYSLDLSDKSDSARPTTNKRPCTQCTIIVLRTIPTYNASTIMMILLRTYNTNRRYLCNFSCVFVGLSVAPAQTSHH